MYTLSSSSSQQSNNSDIIISPVMPVDFLYNLQFFMEYEQSCMFISVLSVGSVFFPLCWCFLCCVGHLYGSLILQWLLLLIHLGFHNCKLRTVVSCLRFFSLKLWLVVAIVVVFVIGNVLAIMQSCPH